MPIVIEDMTVLVEVNQPAQNATSGAGAANPGAATSSGASQATEQIRRCVEEVMEVIRQQNER